MLDSSRVPIEQSALLVIDAQDSFKIGPRWAKRNNPGFEKSVIALVEAYRAAHLPVVFFLHTDKDEGFRRDSPEFKLMNFLKPRNDEPVMIKNTRNCFTSTSLQPYLIEKGVRRVCITGIQMEQCCETSARVAADLGYAVDFVTEATMTFPIPNWDKPGEELGVDAIRERTEYALRRRFARISTVDQMVRELEDTRNRPIA
ncbi:MAG TPA: isochorismatase family protein [Candidatus Bathyarchaeia archaeon]|nr:isochorismatase family protein [Candidatus Bathyarchaeia archaeon]